MENASLDLTLKEIRIQANKTVPEVSKYLTSLGYKASEKTVYSWEAGRSRPTIDIFLDMCKFYGVTDIFSYFGSNQIETKNSPSTAVTVPGEEHVSMEESNRLLVALGLIKEGEDLSDDDLAFLDHIIGLLDAWFRKGH